MTKEGRKNKIDYAYQLLADSEVHKAYKERLIFIKGYTPQKVSSILKKVATYAVDNPDAQLGLVYAGAFGLTVKGKEVPDVTY